MEAGQVRAKRKPFAEFAVPCILQKPLHTRSRRVVWSERSPLYGAWECVTSYISAGESGPDPLLSVLDPKLAPNPGATEPYEAGSRYLGRHFRLIDVAQKSDLSVKVNGKTDPEQADSGVMSSRSAAGIEVTRRSIDVQEVGDSLREHRIVRVIMVDIGRRQQAVDNENGVRSRFVPEDPGGDGNQVGTIVFREERD